LSPATPLRTSCSVVKVPVLSKQQISIFPAKGILNGSVQKMAKQGNNYSSSLTADGMQLNKKRKIGHKDTRTQGHKDTRKQIENKTRERKGDQYQT